MLVHVTVTEEDIRQGVKFFSDACPVALALYRTTGQTHEVGETSVTYQARYAGPIPTEVSTFIETFDVLGASYVQPFEFDIELPWIQSLPAAVANTTVTEERELVTA